MTSKLGFDSLSYHDCKMQSPKRVLVVFGGISGIDAAIEADEKFKSNKIHEVFDIVCENHNIQFGSRSMRLEVIFDYYENIFKLLQNLNLYLFYLF